MIMSRTFSADESFFEVIDRKAAQAGVTPSYLLRAMVSEFLLTHDFLRVPDALGPVWRKKEQADRASPRGQGG